MKIHFNGIFFYLKGMIIVTSDNISVNSDGVYIILDDGSEIVFTSDKTQVKYNIDYSYNANETPGY